MSTITGSLPYWDGSGRTFAEITTSGSNPTPFGYFDADATFEAAAIRFADHAARHLGYPIMDVELEDINFYACLETAMIEYSHHINNLNIVNNLLPLMGTQISGSLNESLISSNLAQIVRLSRQYGTEAGSGGTVDYYSASFETVAGKQWYDLDTAIRTVSSASYGKVIAADDKIEIRKVLHNAPAAIVRYFDPFIGTGLGSQQFLEGFGMGGMSPGVTFMMMPIYADLLRLQAIEFNDQIRRSGYSFQIQNNKIRIFPVPSEAMNVWVHYSIESEKSANTVDYNSGSSKISSLTNVPYNYYQWNDLNDYGRSWVIQFARALAKEMLGNVRLKFASLPIPNAEVQLNGGDLIQQSQEEMTNLKTQLMEFLDKMTRQAMLERQMAEDEAITNTLSKVPLRIYIG